MHLCRHLNRSVRFRSRKCSVMFCNVGKIKKKNFDEISLTGNFKISQR